MAFRVRGGRRGERVDPRPEDARADLASGPFGQASVNQRGETGLDDGVQVDADRRSAEVERGIRYSGCSDTVMEYIALLFSSMAAKLPPW